jgi:hypothetical protein
VPTGILLSCRHGNPTVLSARKLLSSRYQYNDEYPGTAHSCDGIGGMGWGDVSVPEGMCVVCIFMVNVEPGVVMFIPTFRCVYLLVTAETFQQKFTMKLIFNSMFLFIVHTLYVCVCMM